MTKYNTTFINGIRCWLMPDGEILPIIAGGKGGSVNVPGPTPAQEEATRTQTDIMRQQMAMTQQMQREQQLIAPMMYRQYGYSPQFSPTGELTGLEQTPEALAQQQRQSQITGAFQERELAALEGRLPIDPGLMIDLQRQSKAQEATLASQFGMGGQGGTGAMQARDIFEARKSAILEGARRGDLTLAEQMGASAQMRQTQLMERGVVGAGILPQLTMQNIGTLGTVGGGVAQSLVSAGIRQQEMGLQAQIEKARNKAAITSAIIGGAGAVAGGGLQGAGALFSDRRLKTDIKKIGELPLASIGIYSYNKFGRPEIGVMADEVEKIKPEAVYMHPSGFKMVDYAGL